LKEWLKFNFSNGMTFDNYGTYWHMDHVIPCSLFNLTNHEDINNCFKWTNIQPLLSKINLIKNNKEEVINHWEKNLQFLKK
jgi:5-methylcytosine-specific restriction endonuclease McrA